MYTYKLMKNFNKKIEKLYKEQNPKEDFSVFWYESLSLLNKRKYSYRKDLVVVFELFLLGSLK